MNIEKGITFMQDMEQVYPIYSSLPTDPDTFEYWAGEEIYEGISMQEYQRIFPESIINGRNDDIPIFAHLQRMSQGPQYYDGVDLKEIRPSDYEIVYVSDKMGGLTPKEALHELNHTRIVESGHFGGSPKVGDVLAYNQEGKINAYLVTTNGLTALPEDFADYAMHQRLKYRLDVRQEYDLLSRCMSFANDYAIAPLSTSEEDRLAAIEQTFTTAFNRSDVRKVYEENREVLQSLYAYQQISGKSYGVGRIDEKQYYLEYPSAGIVNGWDAKELQEQINLRVELMRQDRKTIQSVSLNESETIKDVSFTANTLPVSRHHVFEEFRFQNCVFEGLENVAFQGCDFEDCIFKGCDLQGTIFQESSFVKTDFKSCSLERSDFTKAYFRDVRFSGCDLSGCNLTLAHIEACPDFISKDTVIKKRAEGVKTIYFAPNENKREITRQLNKSAVQRMGIGRRR